MDERVVVSIHAMGGDHGPCVVVPAIALARDRLARAHVLLHGDQTLINAELVRHPSAAVVCGRISWAANATPAESDRPRNPGSALSACMKIDSHNHSAYVHL
jgi:glycerol-3-phosphate acyltransferase PlsX